METIIINIVIVAVLVTAIVAFLSLRRQKKAVMDEVNRLSLRLTEMEMKVEAQQALSRPLPSREESGSWTSKTRSESSQDGEDEGVVAPAEVTVDEQVTNLSLMNDEELFGYLSKTIKDEEMYRWPDLNRNALMEHFSLSAVRIGNAFVRGGGTGLPEFVRNCRLDYACRLMVEHLEMTFTEVGYQSGYRRTTTFNHDFKARFGMPPAEYREQELRKQLISDE